MSIESSISIAFYPDRNTFATPTATLLAQKVSLSTKKAGVVTSRPSYRICFTELLAKDKGTIEIVYSLLSYAQKQIRVLSQTMLPNYPTRPMDFARLRL